MAFTEKSLQRLDILIDILIDKDLRIAALEAARDEALKLLSISYLEADAAKAYAILKRTI